MRIAGLKKKIQHLGYEVIDYGNISCHDIDEHIPDDVRAEKDAKNARYLAYIIDTAYHLKEKVREISTNKHFPLVLGGDHSISIGTMAGMMALHQGKTGIVWVDAHGDFNTPETTPTGNIHGMPFAVITGRGYPALLEIGPSPMVSEKNAVLIAARDIDVKEAQLLENSQVTVFTMKDIDEEGMAKIARKAISIATKDVDYLHVSFDIDSVDPSIAPGTGTIVQGGLTYREAHLLLEIVHESKHLSSLEMVEINPTLDIKNKTAKLAVDLISSALGKRILP
jgi:arginase